MTSVFYDDIELELVKTNEFILRPVPSDDNVDNLWTHCIIDINAVLNPFATATEAGTTLGPQTLVDLRHRLLQPRKRLIYRIGNVDVIDVPTVIPNNPGQRYAVDTHNGPIVRECRLLPITGSKTLHIRWRVECYLWECTSTIAPNLGVTSHRWEQTAELDDAYLVTRTTVGQVHFRTSYLDAMQLVPDQWRPVIVHPMLPGYRRIRLRFAPSEDRASIRYLIVDREQHLQLDRSTGIADCRASIHHGMTGVIASGFKPMAMSKVVIDMLGQKDMRVEHMINRCIVAAQGLGFPLDGAGQQAFITGVNAIYRMHEHRMLFDASWIFNGLIGGVVAVAASDIGARNWPRRLNDIGSHYSNDTLQRMGPPNPYGDRGATNHNLVLAQIAGIACSDPGAARNAKGDQVDQWRFPDI